MTETIGSELRVVGPGRVGWGEVLTAWRNTGATWFASFALSYFVMGCQQGPKPLVLENESPIVGANQVTLEALGVETVGGVLAPLIQAGTKVPCSVSKVFTTAVDDQSQITVTVFRGNERMTARDHPLGRFQIVNIPAEGRGLPRVQVTFSISDRRISISARDVVRGTEMSVLRLSHD